MAKLTIGWMYPNLLNLHGERGSVQALEKCAKEMGVDVRIQRIEDFDDPIPFSELDLMIFLPGELTQMQYLLPAMKNQMDSLVKYIQDGHYVIALGTTGLLFGKTTRREDGGIFDGLGLLDLTATERKYVWGDDLHFRLEDGTKIIGSQITMADIDSKCPLGITLYGRGNNGSGTEGSRYLNLIHTNCQGPVFVKNPWWAEEIIRETLAAKGEHPEGSVDHTIARNSYKATLAFINEKPKA